MKQFTLLFLRRGDELLLAMKKRGFGAGRWNGAGGKVEAGETIEAAAVRECQEEIGVTPREFQLVAIHDFLFPDGQDMRMHAYMCTSWSGEPSESEEMRPEWFKLANIPYGEMWDDDIVWLPLVLAGKHLRCSFTFDDHEQMCAAALELVNFPKGGA